jgi:hypothetical protein
MRLPVLALLCCGLVAGCGSVLHISKGLGAKRAVERARAANAQERAPYHLALAESYVAQAEIEATGAHAQEALAYDELALDHALKAEALARGEKLPEAPAPPAAEPAKKATKPTKSAPKRTSSDDEDL